MNLSNVVHQILWLINTTTNKSISSVSFRLWIHHLQMHSILSGHPCFQCPGQKEYYKHLKKPEEDCWIMANRHYLKKKKKILKSVFQNTSRKITEMILKNNIFSSKCLGFFSSWSATSCLKCQPTLDKKIYSSCLTYNFTLLKWWSKLPSNLHFAFFMYNKYEFQEKTTFFSKAKSFSHDLENNFIKEWVTYIKSFTLLKIKFQSRLSYLL